VRRRAAVAACSVVAALGCAPEAPPPTSDGLSVLLITLDTFRADRAGCMGHPGGLTPYLDRLARHGRLARNAFAPTPLTAPSHASILTGLEPPTHGVRENGTFALHDSIPRLPAMLAGAGLRTGGFVASFPVESRFGFHVGFEHFDDDVGPPGPDASYYPERPANGVVDAALAWIGGLEPGTRWFLWTHFFDPHQPRTVRRALRRMPAAGDYDREIRGLDCEIGRLLRELTVGVGRLPLTVVVSDHGEGLGDHGESTHGVLLFDGFLRAYHTITAPAGSAERELLPPGIESRVLRHSDVLPTLADLVRFEIPSTVEGASLFEPTANLGAYGESYYATLHYGWSPVWSWRDDRWTYVESTRGRLFDRSRDPAELVDVAGAHPDIVAGFARNVETWAREPEFRDENVDRETQEKLAALGYLAGGATVRPNRSFDPVERIDAVEHFLAGMSLLSAGNALAAQPRLEQVLAADSANVSAVFAMAECYRIVGRPAAASRLYARVLELNPRIGDAWAHAALLELARGNAAESRRLFREGLELNPDAFPLLMAAGDVAARDGEPERARDLYERALAVEPDRAEPLAGLALVAEGLGDPDTARDLWRRALSADPRHPLIPDRVRVELGN